MSARALLFLSIGLAVESVLLLAVFGGLFLAWAMRKETRRRNAWIRSAALDLLARYAESYYGPLRGGLAQLWYGLRDYDKCIDRTTEETFVAYSRVLYFIRAMAEADVPLPLKGAEREQYVSARSVILGTPGFPVSQMTACVRLGGQVKDVATIETGELLRQAGDAYDSFQRRLATISAEEFAALKKAVQDLIGLLSEEIRKLTSVPDAVTVRDLFLDAWRQMWTEVRTLRNLKREEIEREVGHEIAAIRVAVVLGLLTVGTIGLVGGGLSAWAGARAAGLDPPDVLLFARLLPGMREQFAAHLFPTFHGNAGIVTVAAMAGSFGVGMIGAAVALVGDPVRVGTATSGLILGISLTTTVAYLLGWAQFDSITMRLMTFKLTYLYAVFMVLTSLPDLLGRHGLLRGKYERLMSALYTFAAAAILAKGFGSLAVLYTGLVFAPSWFVGSAMVEFIQNRNPELVLAKAVRPISAIEFARTCRRAGGRALVHAGVIIVTTLLFYALMAILYRQTLAGRF